MILTTGTVIEDAIKTLQELVDWKRESLQQLKDDVIKYEQQIKEDEYSIKCLKEDLEEIRAKGRIYQIP
ncbi:MAG: hypothetical protein PHF74_05650 [Dehalococcoidales bacterium]|nr:hypothetical protein [Dehalococcoidales bacterium]